MSSIKTSWRATEAEIKFLDKIKSCWNLPTISDAIHKMFDISMEYDLAIHPSENMAEKPAEEQPSSTLPVAATGQLDSPPLPQQAQPPPTKEAFNPNLHGAAKEPKAVWENGKWTFSKKHLEKLAYEAELQRIKTEGKQARADIDTNEKRKRAMEREKNRQPRRVTIEQPNCGPYSPSWA